MNKRKRKDTVRERKEIWNEGKKRVFMTRGQKTTPRIKLSLFWPQLTLLQNRPCIVRRPDRLGSTRTTERLMNRGETAPPPVPFPASTPASRQPLQLSVLSLAARWDRPALPALALRWTLKRYSLSWSEFWPDTGKWN